MTESTTTSAARPPDRPPVPRARRSVLSMFVVGFAVLVLGGYTAVAVTQRELRSVEKDEIPGSVRSSPGGYRSYSFWHSGYHGGK
jgi:hypothetical protein